MKAAAGTGMTSADGLEDLASLRLSRVLPGGLFRRDDERIRRGNGLVAGFSFEALDDDDAQDRRNHEAEDPQHDGTNWQYALLDNHSTDHRLAATPTGLRFIL